MDAAYSDKLDHKISEEFWQRKQADWETEERRINSLIAGLNEDESAERLLNLAQDFRTRAKCLFAVPYAETGRTGRIAQESTFELFY